ncbi:MAG: hypothetical protein GX267_19095 [Fibrobacter sp.]|nr:hypothetical protein [Fibrobacter sp.]
MIQSALVILLFSFSVLAALPEDFSFTPYGMAQYRLRYEFLSEKYDGKTISSGNYFNTIGYKVGLKASVNSQVDFQFEIGNDWGSTEAVSVDNSNMTKNRADLYPFFSLAFVRWNPGYMHIQAGRVPVKATSVTDILGISLQRSNSGKDIRYESCSHQPWVASTNGTMDGLRIGAPISKKEFKLGVDLFTTVITQRTAPLSENFLKNADGVMVMLDFPMSYKGLSLLPQFIAIPYRKYDQVNKEKDHELMGGLQGDIKINQAFSLRFGYGFAVFYQNVLSDSSSAKDVVVRQIGMNGGVGSSLQIGPGKLDLDLKIGSDDDRETQMDKQIFPYIETLYTWVLNKHFSVRPRLRVFITTTETEKTVVRSRPELIFNGSF